MSKDIAFLWCGSLTAMSAHRKLHTTTMTTAQLMNSIDSDEDSTSQASGRIRFDARGNATYEWSDTLLSAQGELSLEDATIELSLAVTEAKQAASNPSPAVGYNPYESGSIAQVQHSNKKPSLRELSKWIELKRRLNQSS
ncbi:MAG: hypothetical protein QM808_06025 [Steroidobacteraceae bacterium]